MLESEEAEEKTSMLPVDSSQTKMDKAKHLQKMKKNIVQFYCFVFVLLLVEISNAQPVLIHGKGQDFSRINSSLPVEVSLFTQSENGVQNLIYQETNTVIFKDSGRYELMLGKGKQTGGNTRIDSVIWNLDEYIVWIKENNNKEEQKKFKDRFVLRKESKSVKFKQEGIIEKKESDTYGMIEIPLDQKSLPQKITIDFTSSYINVNYPGGRYPIFRHYEWFRSDDTQKGNCFMLTYSEKNTHEYWQNTDKFGDVRIHEKAFQDLKYELTRDKLKINLSKPEQQRFLSETYAIKGPWKIIYLIEW
jgi:hypothetical protein